MDIFLIQAVANGIPDLLMSQNETKAIGLFFYLWKILIDAEFSLFLIGQRVCIKGRRISEQRSVHC